MKNEAWNTDWAKGHREKVAISSFDLWKAKAFYNLAYLASKEWDTNKEKEYREQIVALPSDDRPEIQELQEKVFLKLVALKYQAWRTTIAKKQLEQITTLSFDQAKALFNLGQSKYLAWREKKKI